MNVLYHFDEYSARIWLLRKEAMWHSSVQPQVHHRHPLHFVVKTANRSNYPEASKVSYWICVCVCVFSVMLWCPMCEFGTRNANACQRQMWNISLCGTAKLNVWLNAAHVQCSCLIGCANSTTSKANLLSPQLTTWKTTCNHRRECLYISLLVTTHTNTSRRRSVLCEQNGTYTLWWSRKLANQANHVAATFHLYLPLHVFATVTTLYPPPPLL